MYPPRVVANYILDRASIEGRALTQMQLLKLVYIAHGYHLAYYDEPLINEKVEAWKHGPVVSSLYHELKKYGRGAVERPLGALPWARVEMDPKSKKLVDAVWGSYGHFSGLRLSQITHLQETPWHKVWQHDGGSTRRAAVIDDSLTRDYYRAQICQEQQQTMTG